MAMKAFMEPIGADLVCEDPFDSIDDLLDFPNDDDGLPIVDAWDNCAPITPAPAPAMIAAENAGGINVGGAACGIDGRAAAVSGDGISSENDALGLYDDIDIANLEWLSNFFEDADFNFDFIPNSTPSTPDTKPEHKTPSLSRSSSPISVLLPTTSSSSSSSSSASSSNSITDTSPPPPPLPTSVPARARTKRPRLPSFSARTFIPPSSNIPNFSPVAIKKMKKEHESVPSVRKCTHCDIQKTPQWRAGPMGPKTLCNACGVRYKSGRLFPEYRPAASPTFVPAVHSNSHKKVVEMRLRCSEMVGKIGGREVTVSAKNCDLLQYIRRRD